MMSISDKIKYTRYDIRTKYQYQFNVKYQSETGETVDRKISFDTDKLISQEEALEKARNILTEKKKEYFIKDLEDLELDEIAERMDEEDAELFEDFYDDLLDLGFRGQDLILTADRFVNILNSGDDPKDYVIDLDKLSPSEIDDLKSYYEELKKLDIDSSEIYDYIKEFYDTIIELKKEK